MGAVRQGDRHGKCLMIRASWLIVWRSALAALILLATGCGLESATDLDQQRDPLQVELPATALPEVEPPTIAPPELELPGSNPPEVELPQLEAPQVELPASQPPDVGRSETEQTAGGPDSVANPGPTSEGPAAATNPMEVLLGLIDSLVVDTEYAGGYDRSLFRHWVDADGDGCDTRREVLLAEAVTTPAISGDCSLSGGSWASRYDNALVAGSGRGFDVDHLVPLKEAWDSGAYAWSPLQRQLFANDLGHPDALVAVSASSNRSKGARDPSTWLPPLVDQHCWYVSAWISVKSRWSLTVDPQEVATLRDVISGCDPDDLVVPRSNPVPGALVASAASDGAVNATLGATDESDCHPSYQPCIPNLAGNALNCSDLSANQKPVTIIGGDPYRLDGDGDGRGCEG